MEYYSIVHLLHTDPSGAPQNVALLSSSATSVMFSWSEVACGQRNGSITGYDCTLRIKDGMTLQTTHSPDEVEEISGLNLQCGVNYEFAVKAVNSIGAGPEETFEFTVDLGKR